MFVVTNTIKTQAENAEKIVQQFMSGHTGKAMEGIPGFQKFELLNRSNCKNPAVSEIVVLSYWESRAHQKAWVSSNSFKQLHKRERPKEHEGKETSMIISSEIAEYDVL
ncbi:antibiotic biosynthesis monooxygenase [Isobaculum melis]|uniref:Heme oxygenase (Staphylobilin-producing) n=1 Tax=Isobaculum melis TaxID=142588 RepID=A0A1H9T1Q9_9LACT|nr:antibiotic biosynthesis monooxygenase [Isobaculum melis]SER91202.1 heme oxygenase (staphylobilin-producing) [Isobaculum melis]